MKTFITRTLVVIVAIALAVTLPLSALAEAGRGTDAPARGEIWDGSIAEGFAGGTGTEADPYLISNGAELAYLAQQVNSGTSYEGSYFELTEDIYLNDTTNWESWGDDTAPANEWTPIGTGDNSFSGSFDGNGHAVHGVYINELESDYQGLFGYANRSTIANLDVSESCIHGDYAVGGVVGESVKCTISDCYNAGSVTGSSNVGGVAGDTAYSEITNCYNTGSVTGVGNVGGVVGYNYSSCVYCVTNCYNTGSVTGDGCVGGVVGNNDGGSFAACYNTGSVTGGSNVGGVVGFNFDGDFSTLITNCYNTGSVTGGSEVGGVVGGTSGYYLYTEIDVEYGTVANCYNTGSVTGSENVGGVAGSIGDINVEVADCYYLATCCSNGNEYGTALTDEQMRVADSFVGFDFAEVWTMEGNASYPYPELISNHHAVIYADTEPTPEPTSEPTPAPGTTQEPDNPAPPATGAVSLMGIGIAAAVAGAGSIALTKRKK